MARRGPVDVAHHDPDTADVMAVREAIERLPRCRRACVILHHLAGLDTDEVAAALEIAPATVRSHLRHAHADLRASLGDAADCRFDASASTTTLLGIEGRDVNVTVRELGASPTTGLPVTRSVDGVDYMLTRGTADLQSSVTVSSRAVLIEGDRYRFVVKVAQ